MRFIIGLLIAALLFFQNAAEGGTNKDKRHLRKANVKNRKRDRGPRRSLTRGPSEIIVNPFIKSDQRAEPMQYVVTFWDNSQQEIVSFEQQGEFFLLRGGSGQARYPKRMIVSISRIAASKDFRDAEVSEQLDPETLAEIFRML